MRDKDYGFLYAIPLGLEESRAREQQGCLTAACTQITLYGYSDGGTVEAILNLKAGIVFDSWIDLLARLGASPNTVPRALAIVSADTKVTSMIGDLRTNEPMMVPMSTWLDDNACSQDLRVDLTFLSPDESSTRHSDP